MTPTVAAALVMGTVGGQAWLAARVEVPPAWHVYWENPGDSGLATRVTLDALRWKLGEPRYPGPERVAAPGGLTHFGWHGGGAVLLPVERARGPLSAELRWLACTDDLCVPGSASWSYPRPTAIPRADLSSLVSRLPTTPAASEIALLPGLTTYRPRARPRDAFPNAAASGAAIAVTDGEVTITWPSPTPPGAAVVVATEDARFTSVDAPR